MWASRVLSAVQAVASRNPVRSPVWRLWHGESLGQQDDETVLWRPLVASILASLELLFLFFAKFDSRRRDTLYQANSASCTTLPEHVHVYTHEHLHYDYVSRTVNFPSVQSNSWYDGKIMSGIL